MVLCIRWHIVCVFSLLWVTLTLYASSADSISNTPPSHTLKLDEVTVVSDKVDVSSSSFRLLTTLQQEDINTMAISTVADILQILPGIDVRTRGANGSQADLSMRGGTFDQVLVMVNGVILSDAHTGHYNLNLPVPLSAIKRVEILQGNNVAMAAGQAFSGAVNIVTAHNDSNTYNLKYETGMNAYNKVELSGTWALKQWHLSAAAEYSRSNGYYAPSPSAKEQTAIDNSDYKLSNVYLNASYKGLYLQVGAQYKDAGAGMFYGFGSQNQFDATRTIFGSAEYKYQANRWLLDAQLTYRANYDRYEWHRGQRKYGNFHFMQQAGATLKVNYVSSWGTTALGIRAYNENIYSTNLGDTVNHNGQIPNVDGFALRDVRVLDLVMGKNRFNINYFVNQTFHYRGLSASVGVTGHYNTLSAHQWAADIDLGYTISPDASVYLNANRAFRLPTFTDMYYNAGNQLGNRYLKPEKAWALSLGGNYNHSFNNAGDIHIMADAYYRWGRDIIDWIYTPSDLVRPFHAQNHQTVDAAGVECSMVYHLNQWLREVRISYAYTYLDLDLHSSGSRYLDYLKHKLTLRLIHSIYKGLGASYTLNFRERTGQYNDAEGNIQDFQSVWLLDAELFYELSWLKVAFSCTNITNRHYYDYGGILQPGAWFKTSLTWTLH